MYTTFGKDALRIIDFKWFFNYFLNNVLISSVSHLNDCKLSICAQLDKCYKQYKNITLGYEKL